MSAFPSARNWAFSKFKVSNPMSYTADTTQPDVLDVVFFLVGVSANHAITYLLMVYLLFFSMLKIKSPSSEIYGAMLLPCTHIPYLLATTIFYDLFDGPVNTCL
jgi:hypothetical protein